MTITVSLSALADARNLRLFKDETLLNLRQLVYRAAKCTHEAGNRRYGDLIFLMEGDEVKKVSLRKEGHICLSCFGTKHVRQFNACDSCDGDGCKLCNDEGGTVISIPCPDC